MIAFVLHDDDGNLKGIVIPENTEPGRRCGVRSHNGHEVSVIELPKIEPAKLDAHVSHLIATHRLERATADKPARLVPKPRKRR